MLYVERPFGPSIPPTAGVWIACIWTTWEPIQFNIWLAQGARAGLFCTIYRKITKSADLTGPTPTGWSDLYTHAMKTKIGGIESPMLGASHASKLSYGNHLRGTHQEV